MLRNVGRAVIVKGGKDSSLDCALFNTYRRSKEPSESAEGDNSRKRCEARGSNSHDTVRSGYRNTPNTHKDGQGH